MKNFAIGVATLLALNTIADTNPPPLKAPTAPKAEIRGTPGKRTLYNGTWAADTNGHSAYSAITVVTNAPDSLSERDAIVLTPAPVSNATQYAILTSRAEAPSALSIAVKVAGDRTFYYWMQARKRTVWAPLTGPFKAEGFSPPHSPPLRPQARTT